MTGCEIRLPSMSVCGGGGRLWMVVMNRGTIGQCVIVRM